ncbi:MAG TPA: EamA family transporter RarD [Melioribacteraceae bacterium]|nr:EamA family transporter RarD [Melioribacteraceae bacterium]
MNKGLSYVLFAYIFWGLHPIYWKLLDHIPSLVIVSNRIIWSFIFFSIIVVKRNLIKVLINKLKKLNIKNYLIPAILIGLNWFGYVWAINNNYIIETSLGYYLSPFASVLLGVFLLNEKLSSIKWIAILLALFGVLIMVFYYGSFPFVAFYLAITWSIYGYLRKKSSLTSLEGLTVETGLLFIPSLIITFLISKSNNSLVFSNIDYTLLIGSGLISGLPLLVFISGSKLINLSVIGILQYLYSTMVFLLGYFVYNEPLTLAKLIGFIFIWIGLITFTTESYILKVFKSFYTCKQVNNF